MLCAEALVSCTARSLRLVELLSSRRYGDDGYANGRAFALGPACCAPLAKKFLLREIRAHSGASMMGKYPLNGQICKNEVWLLSGLPSPLLPLLPALPILPIWRCKRSEAAQAGEAGKTRPARIELLMRVLLGELCPLLATYLAETFAIGVAEWIYWEVENNCIA